MAPLLQNGTSSYDQAMDLCRRREFARASEKFRAAATKFMKEGAVPHSYVAAAYADLLEGSVAAGSVEPMRRLAAYLRTTLPQFELKPGPRPISGSELGVQLDLLARRAELLAAAKAHPHGDAGIAAAMQGLAMEFQALGPQVLFTTELFEQRVVAAESYFPPLMAMSYDLLGRCTQHSDPLTAADRYRTAQQYWLQAGLEADAADALTRADALSAQSKCWFCGREGTGHGIQFVSLPVLPGVLGHHDPTGSPLPSVDGTATSVYACRGCHSAVSGLADEIATARAEELERRLTARIRAVEARLNAMNR